MAERQEEGARCELAPSPDNDLPTQKEVTGEHGSRKALAACLAEMAADARRTYIESAAHIGLNNSDHDCSIADPRRTPAGGSAGPQVG
jgi:hypothetical protein